MQNSYSGKKFPFKKKNFKKTKLDIPVSYEKHMLQIFLPVFIVKIFLKQSSLDIFQVSSSTFILNFWRGGIAMNWNFWMKCNFLLEFL